MDEFRSDPTRAELERQFKFFDSRAKRYGFLTQLIRYVNAVSASAAAIFGIFTSYPAYVPGVLAAVVAIFAIVDQQSHPEREWIRTRLTAEALRSERTLYDAKAQEYANVGNPSALLAVRIDAIRKAELGEYFAAVKKDADAESRAKGTK